MKISVAFEDSRNDALLRKVRAAAEYSYGFRDEIRQLSRDYGTGAVIDAIVRVCSEGGLSVCWDEYSIEEWLYDYFAVDCFDDLISAENCVCAT